MEEVRNTHVRWSIALDGVGEWGCYLLKFLNMLSTWSRIVWELVQIFWWVDRTEIVSLEYVNITKK